MIIYIKQNSALNALYEFKFSMYNNYSIKKLTASDYKLQYSTSDYEV